MAKGGVYSKYRMIVTALGLRELDVYRVVKKEGGASRTVDIIRVFDPSTGKVALVDLGTVREALSFESFIEKLVGELEKAGIRVSERRLDLVKSKLLPQLARS
jgi:hypothetical protein